MSPVSQQRHPPHQQTPPRALCADTPLINSVIKTFRVIKTAVYHNGIPADVLLSLINVCRPTAVLLLLFTLNGIRGKALIWFKACVHTHTKTHTNTNTNTQTLTHIYTHTYTLTHIHTCRCKHINKTLTRTLTHTYTHTSTHANTETHTCTHKLTHTHTHTSTHADTHTHTEQYEHHA